MRNYSRPVVAPLLRCYCSRSSLLSLSRIVLALRSSSVFLPLGVHSFVTTSTRSSVFIAATTGGSSPPPFSTNFLSPSPAPPATTTTTKSDTCLNMSPTQEETAAVVAAAAAAATSTTEVVDPYIWLEDIESEESLNFARAANEDCLSKLGNPEEQQQQQPAAESSGGAAVDGQQRSYERILKVLESDDRIPHVSKYGNIAGAATGSSGSGGEEEEESGADAILYNFWKDAQNRRGIWRKTTMSSYTSNSNNNQDTKWTTVLDIDALGEKDGVPWVYGGNSPLPRSRDDAQQDVPKSQQQVVRVLVSLSRGGSDAKLLREFDLQAMDFVSNMIMEKGEEAAFDLPNEAKTRCSYKSRNVLLVATDFGEGTDSLTDSGYPRTVREWVRGTDLKDAPVVFEGEKTDVSVSQYISDERTHGGDIYEVQSRSMTFYTSRYWMRKLQPEHLLAVNNPKRLGISPPPDFVQLDLQDDVAEASLLGNLILISLRSDWQPRGDGSDGPTYNKGSVIYTNTDKFLAHGAAACDFEILFEPTERTAYEYWTATKTYLILSTMDNVKSKLEFFKIHSSKGDGTTTLTPVAGGATTVRIRECSCSPMDPYDGSDLFWFTKSDYITPSSLYLADATRVEKQQDKSMDSGDDNDVFIVDKLKSLPPQFDANNLVVQQRTAISKDGTEIPYFIIMHKDVVLNGKNPTLLYGYGGFEVSLSPHYIAVTGLAWLERGGVYVEANIRGGGEFGPAWHQAALLEKRHKAYEDFAAVGEHLIESNICKPKTLAIRGGSNGGLLVANMYVMRPDLFGAIHCAVPLLDMQRYHKLLAGASWMAEYGNPDTDDWEKFLHKYSPYHNIQPGTKYPPILVTTSTRDDRVHPGHARKFVKKLWDSKVENVYYYENIEGGHGGAADAKQSAFMTALAYDFMFHTLEKNAKDME